MISVSLTIAVTAPAPAPAVPEPVPAPADAAAAVTAVPVVEPPAVEQGPQPAPTEAAGSSLPDGVYLYTDAHLVIGQVDPGRRRLSDHLNDNQRAYLEVTHAAWCDLLAESAPPSPAGLVTLRKEIIALVVPGEETGARVASRVPTQLVPIALALPLFLIVGSLHRRTGDPTNLLQWFIESGRQFVPVSMAIIRFLPNSRFDPQLGLVLVNIRQVHFWWTPSAHHDA